MDNQRFAATYFANIVANIVYVLASFMLYKKWVFRM